MPAPTTAPSWSSYAPTIAMTVTSCGPTQPHDSKRCARPTARSWKPSLPTEPATTPTRTAASGPEGSAAVGVATSSHPRLAEEATQHRGLNRPGAAPLATDVTAQAGAWPAAVVMVVRFSGARTRSGRRCAGGVSRVVGRRERSASITGS